MVLSGVGDALGYKNGLWEFCYSGTKIHEELEKLGGLDKIDIKGWRVSDDTVLHIATAEALVSEWATTEELLCIMATKYKKTCTVDMFERAPGQTTTKACFMLRPLEEKGYIIPFNARGGGCDAAMRSMCIGWMFPCEDQIEMLIEITVESGRMTHNHPTEDTSEKWGAGLFSVLPKVWEYIEKVGRDVEENNKAWSYFKNSWESCLELRGLANGTSEPKFPVTYNIPERDAFYKSVSYADSDSTGILAATWWGGMYGMKGVPLGNYRNLEYGLRLMELDGSDEILPEDASHQVKREFKIASKKGWTYIFEMDGSDEILPEDASHQVKREFRISNKGWTYICLIMRMDQIKSYQKTRFIG
ncbi:protein ADP-ribosylarginine hydrolase-like [Xenia sp. Carnegie-2017]|uniref:protein ADP-ribosylarginine hydrolase-like n=1 Tax=Xenia sp. Carnegie-2017 TaxID=2897299 RepID=UPI001F049454|nr:protein ADP-ribosylarginine hydrolase-like [Xenia sp. Carnegie-2017]